MINFTSFLLFTFILSSVVLGDSIPNKASRRLREDGKPWFRKQTINDANGTRNTLIGRQLRLNCGTRGKPKSKIQFFKDGKEIQNSDQNFAHIEIRKTMILIRAVQLQDTGIYTCVATNTYGSASLNFSVVVHEEEKIEDPRLPRWTKPYQMIKTLHAEPAGNTVVLKCIAAGENITTVWYKNNVKIVQKDNRNPPRLGGYKFRHSNQVITLESVVLGDVGFYTCIVKNQYASINHTYQLDVSERSVHKPILSNLRNETVYVGENVTFYCSVFSDPHPHIRWIRNIPGNARNNQTILLKQNHKAGLNSTEHDLQTFTVKNVTLGDSGKYSCVAGNSIGVSHLDAWLTVKERPLVTSSRSSVVWIFIALPVIFGMVVVNVIYCWARSRSTAPKLTPIKNPDCIPAMEHLEEPGVIFGDEIWQKLLFSGGNPPLNSMLDINNHNLVFDAHWEINRKNIFLHERIDEGFFGQVFRAGVCYNRDGKNEQVMGAVKMLKNNRSEKDMADLITEMEQLKRIGTHVNIISLIGICTQEGLLWLITEYAEQGNLRDFLRRNRPSNVDLPEVPDNLQAKYLQVPPRGEPITYQNLISASYQVARGMEFLAQKKCVHRDLAARNVLVTEGFVMKIADFGLARDVRSQEYYRKVSRGHLPYKWMAIEAMVENVFTHSTDVWSFGVLLWEVFTLGGSPYPGIKTAHLVQFLKAGNRLEHPQFASPLLYRLMRDCWEEEPLDRPRFRLLLEDLERMLNATTSEDYIDLNVPCEMDYSVIESECESDLDDLDRSSQDSASITGEDSDSVFERIEIQDEEAFNGCDEVPLLNMFENKVDSTSSVSSAHVIPNMVEFKEDDEDNSLLDEDQLRIKSE